MLCGVDGVDHDADVAARGVLHADGNVEAAGREAVLLVLHGSRAHGNVRQKVREIPVVLRVEHLVRAGEAVVRQGRAMQLTDGNDALVAVARGAGLVGVDARDDENLVRHLVLYLAKLLDVRKHRVAMVRRAGPDDQQKAVALTVENRLNLLVALALDRGHGVGDGVLLLHVLGNRELSEKLHVHMVIVLRKPF